MKKNMGSMDRIIRAFLAIVFLTIYFTGIMTGTSAIVLLVLGIVFLLTLSVSFCPIYRMFGINSLPKKDVYV